VEKQTDTRIEVFETIEKVRRTSHGLVMALLLGVAMLVLMTVLVVTSLLDQVGLLAMACLLIAAILVCLVFYIRSMDSLLDTLARYIRSRPASFDQKSLPKLEQIARAVNAITEHPMPDPDALESEEDEKAKSD
jgi:hypothetical protein